MASLLRSRFLVSWRPARVGGGGGALRDDNQNRFVADYGMACSLSFSMASVVIALQRISVQLLTLLMPSENKLKLEI